MLRPCNQNKNATIKKTTLCGAYLQQQLFEHLPEMETFRCCVCLLYLCALLSACLEMENWNKQEMSGAEAGMSVLAQAAGLLDIEDAVEEDGALSGSYSDNSSSGVLYPDGAGSSAGAGSRSTSSSSRRGGPWKAP